MNAVCTVVSKMWYARALALGDSLKEVHPDVAFHILLMGEVDTEFSNITLPRYPTIEFKDIGIENYNQLVFKYNVQESCGLAKPFFIEWLFDKYSYDKIVLLGADTYIYNRMDVIFDFLNDNHVILTPHITNVKETKNCYVPERLFLPDGVFNSDFMGFKNTLEAFTVLKWLENKLIHDCYFDHYYGLFSEQNWLNLIPCFFDKGVGILRHPGCNVAHWNIHERIITKKDGIYYINESYLLIFYHFSQVDIEKRDFGKLAKYQPPSNDFKGYLELHEEYCDHVIENRHDQYIKLPHSYDFFSNGHRILNIHRRLYRALLEQTDDISDPFDATGPFYQLLDMNHLLLDIDNPAVIDRKNLKNYERQVNKLLRSMLFIKKIFGLRAYLLIKKIGWFIQDDNNQLFLLEGYDKYFRKK